MFSGFVHTPAGAGLPFLFMAENNAPLYVSTSILQVRKQTQGKQSTPKGRSLVCDRAPSTHCGNLGCEQACSPEGPTLALLSQEGGCGLASPPTPVTWPLLSTGSQAWARWPPSPPAPGEARAWLKRLPPQGKFLLLANHRQGHSGAQALALNWVKRLGGGSALGLARVAGQVMSTVPSQRPGLSCGTRPASGYLRAQAFMKCSFCARPLKHPLSEEGTSRQIDSGCRDQGTGPRRSLTPLKKAAHRPGLPVPPFSTDRGHRAGSAQGSRTAVWDAHLGSVKAPAGNGVTLP